MPLKMVYRTAWGAMEPKVETPLETPVPHVILRYHSKTQACEDPAECRQHIRNLQKYQMLVLKHDDLDYNFYIGGDGAVYQGRGWYTAAVDDHEYSGKSIDIAYIGNWDEEISPSEVMVEAFRDLVADGIKRNFIKEDYKLTELRLSDLPEGYEKGKC